MPVPMKKKPQPVQSPAAPIEVESAPVVEDSVTVEVEEAPVQEAKTTKKGRSKKKSSGLFSKMGL